MLLLYIWVLLNVSQVCNQKDHLYNKKSHLIIINILTPVVEVSNWRVFSKLSKHPVDL